METSEQKDAAPKKCCAAGGIFKGLFVLSVLLVLFIMALALGTFLVPIGSLTNISLCFLLSLALTVFLNRKLLGYGEQKPGEAAQNRSHGRFFAVLLLLILVCGGVLSLTRAHWHAKAEAARIGLALRGFPVSLAEFQQELPDDSYAYPRLMKAVETDFDPAFYNKAKHADAGISRWTPETAKQEALGAAHYAPYLERTLAPLLKRKYDRYMKVDYLQASLDPLKMPVPKLGNFSTIARAAKIRAVSLAVKGETAKAWELVRLQFALSDVLAGERSLLGKMVVLAIRGQGVEAAAGILLNRPGAVIPKDLLFRLRTVSGGGLAAEGLKGELAYQYDIYNFIDGLTFRKFAELGGFSSMLLQAPGSLPLGGVRAEYFLFSLLRRMGVMDLNSMAAAGYFSTAAEPGGWAQVSERSREAEARVSALPSWPFLFVKYSLPSFSLQVKDFEVQARARMTLALAELRRYRQERGKYPPKLSDLGSRSLFQDVFTGTDFIYEPAAGGFDLCSAGAAGDRKENSGKDLCIRQRP